MSQPVHCHLRHVQFIERYPGLVTDPVAVDWLTADPEDQESVVPVAHGGPDGGVGGDASRLATLAFRHVEDLLGDVFTPAAGDFTDAEAGVCREQDREVQWGPDGECPGELVVGDRPGAPPGCFWAFEEERGVAVEFAV